MSFPLDRNLCENLLFMLENGQVLEVVTVQGRDGAIVGRVVSGEKKGLVVLFKNPPRETGATLICFEYEIRKSRSGEKEYAKCFNWVVKSAIDELKPKCEELLKNERLEELLRYIPEQYRELARRLATGEVPQQLPPEIDFVAVEGSMRDRNSSVYVAVAANGKLYETPTYCSNPTIISGKVVLWRFGMSIPPMPGVRRYPLACGEVIVFDTNVEKAVRLGRALARLSRLDLPADARLMVLRKIMEKLGVGAEEVKTGEGDG